jgi:hypothetical protein
MLPALIGFAALVWTNMQFVLPQIAEKGLRLEYAIVFPFLLITGLPILAFMFGKIGTEPIVRYKLKMGEKLPGLTLKQSFKEWRFWLLCIAIVPISYALGAIIPNLEQVLKAQGFSASESGSRALEQ